MKTNYWNYPLITGGIMFKNILIAILLMGLFYQPVYSAMITRHDDRPAKEYIILGSPTETSVTLSVHAIKVSRITIQYGEQPGIYNKVTESFSSSDGYPIVALIKNLIPDRRYYYRIQYWRDGQSSSQKGGEYSFQTARSKGSTFSFGVQGDSHPERATKMFNKELYIKTMNLVAEERPDFYIMMGDDFSLDRLISRNTFTQKTVDEKYYTQRNQFLNLIGHSTALFLVNGNHEHASKLSFGTKYHNVPLFAANARNKFFSLPAPDDFYSGDLEVIEGVDGDGLLRDYYAWTWGDALFVTIDPYWHSPVYVDGGPGKNTPKNTWDASIGDAQYAWLKKTLEESDARYKFIFSHHVNGTGRGAAKMAHSTEWGGYNRSGTNWEFDKYRPDWKLPIHQLMVKNNVTIIFQGHDHIYSREMLDGIVYQSVPNPADNTYTPFNCSSYDTDRITFPGASYNPDYGVVFPNSGYLNVTVSPDQVRVDYIRSFLPKDEVSGHVNGELAYSYKLPTEEGEKGIDFVCPPSAPNERGKGKGKKGKK